MGDKMNSVIEKKGNYLGKDYLCIGYTDMGHRCGYVAVEKDSPLNGVSYDQIIENKKLNEINNKAEIGNKSVMTIFAFKEDCPKLITIIDVHGGLTFSDNHPELLGDDRWYFGFDCMHLGDRTDFDLIEDENFERIKRQFDTGGIVRDVNYVKDECKQMIEQINEIENELK